VNNRTLAVVCAGLSQPSSTRLLAERLAEATRRRLATDGVAIDVEVFDLRDHAHDVVNNLLTGFASPGLRAVIDTVAGADGLIAVTPIFNASYSGLFKSFLDVMPDISLVDKPVLVAATGGTARHSLALEYAVRPMFAYLRAAVTPTAVFASSEDWGGEVRADEAAEGSLHRRVLRAAGELADQIRRREPVTPVDPFTLTTSFEQLLAGD
jgi:FMN reductase